MKFKSLPNISRKDLLKIQNLQKENNLPENIKKWINCFFEQQDLHSVIKLFNENAKSFQNPRFKFTIFPNTQVSIFETILKEYHKYDNFLKDFQKAINNKNSEKIKKYESELQY
jgi:CRISPR/Cas system Type II protein with McrA/HNH and RuvC-like nuclease domain